MAFQFQASQEAVHVASLRVVKRGEKRTAMRVGEVGDPHKREPLTKKINSHGTNHRPANKFWKNPKGGQTSHPWLTLRKGRGSGA